MFIVYANFYKKNVSLQKTVLSLNKIKDLLLNSL